MTNHSYTIIEQVVNADDFVRLRLISGLTPRPLEAAKQALPNSLYGVHICTAERTIAMGRVVGR